MAITNASITVTTSPTLLSNGDTDTVAGQCIYVTNTGANPIILGNATVTATTGYRVAAGASAGPFKLGNGESLYGIVAAATETMGVMRMGS